MITLAISMRRNLGAFQGAVFVKMKDPAVCEEFNFQYRQGGEIVIQKGLKEFVKVAERTDNLELSPSQQAILDATTAMMIPGIQMLDAYYRHFDCTSGIGLPEDPPWYRQTAKYEDSDPELNQAIIDACS